MAPLLLLFTACAEPSNNEDTSNSDEIGRIGEYLRPIVRTEKWTGDRWRVTGIRGDYPVTESIGPWEVVVSATSRDGVFELQGIVIGKAREVELDINLGVLSIDGVQFGGKPLTGKSPIVRDAAFKGASFESTQRGISGSASMLLLEDGRLLLDFYKVRADGSRGEYGLLSPTKVETAP